jgi:4-amino-4-deoxy-L-arabinose transferase-like glycosyltransferase
LAALYLFDLSGVGVLQTDEPRYLAIGEAMAHSGDWITPRLWGAPWFEKPPLLYWMASIGASAGLGPELAGRLPVAVLSLLFLWTAYHLLSREFGAQSAAIAVLLLGTSAGWLAYSQLALTDLPLSVFFSAAVFLALPLLHDKPYGGELNWRFLLMGVCFGLGMLAKGLVPVALSVPFIWFLRRYWRKWWLTFATALIVALPWYVAVYVRNGAPFVQELFFKHHLQRLYSASLQHVQPWFYYFPVLIVGLWPWTPVLAFLCRKTAIRDQRRRFLASIVVFGFILFSVTLNKLPGYLLPLLPALFALVGAQFETKPVAQISRGWLVCSACLIALIPLLASVLPSSLARGRISLASIHVGRTEWFYILLPIAAVLVARRSWAGTILVLCVIVAGIYLKLQSFPILDQMASPRGLWREVGDKSHSLCDAGTNREWLYGFEFYHGAALPVCAPGQHFQYQIHSSGHGRPVIVPFSQ